jgi:transcriptional regulator with XRE-family HTH domain
MHPERLIEIRRALGLSQEEMARVLGVCFATVNRWENGCAVRTGIALEVYRAIGAALATGKTVHDILGDGRDHPGRLLHRIFHAAYGSGEEPADPDEQAPAATLRAG